MPIRTIENGDFVNQGRDKFNESLGEIPVSFDITNAGDLVITKHNKGKLNVPLKNVFALLSQVAEALLPGLATPDVAGSIFLVDDEAPEQLEDELRVLTAPQVRRLIQEIQTKAVTLKEVTKNGNSTPDAIKAEAFLRKTLIKKITGLGVTVFQRVFDEFGAEYYAEFLLEWKPLAQVLAEEIDQPAIKIWFNKIVDFANDADLVRFFNRLKGLGLFDGLGGGGKGGCFGKPQAELAYQYWASKREIINPDTQLPWVEPVFPDCSETTPTTPTNPTSTNPTLTHVAHYVLAAIGGTGAIYSGVIDQVDCWTIKGWLYNTTNKAERCFVDVFLFGKKVATLSCYRPRDDVANEYNLPDNRVEFYYTIPDEYKSYPNREIIVVVAGTRIPLSGSPAIINSCAITAPTTQTGEPYVDGANSVTVGGAGAPQSIKLKQPSGTADTNFVGTVAASVVSGNKPGIGFEGNTSVFKAGEGTTSVGLTVKTQYVFTLNGTQRTLTKDIQVLVPGCTRPTQGLTTVLARWNFTPNNATAAIPVTWDNSDRLVIEHYSRVNAGTFSGDSAQIQSDFAVGREAFHLVKSDCAKLSDNVYFLQGVTGENTHNLIVEVKNGAIVRRKVPAFVAVNLVGQIDEADCRHISGHWFDSNNTADKRKVQLYIGNTAVADLIANQHRPDVANEYKIPSADYCGIDYIIPDDSILKNGQTHDVGFRDVLTGDYLPGGPKQITCNVAPENRRPVLNDPMPDVPVYTSAEYTFALPDAQFTDPDGDALTTQVLQTNGQPLPGWLTYLPQTRQFKKADGISSASVAVLVRATDPKGLFATDDFLVVVAVPSGPRITRVDFEFVRVQPGANAANKLRVWTKVEGATNGVTTQFNTGPNSPDYIIGNQTASADGTGYTHYREYIGANMNGTLYFLLGPIDPATGGLNDAGKAVFSFTVPAATQGRTNVYSA